MYQENQPSRHIGVKDRPLPPGIQEGLSKLSPSVEKIMQRFEWRGDTVGYIELYSRDTAGFATSSFHIFAGPESLLNTAADLNAYTRLRLARFQQPIFVRDCQQAKDGSLRLNQLSYRQTDKLKNTQQIHITAYPSADLAGLALSSGRLIWGDPAYSRLRSENSDILLRAARLENLLTGWIRPEDLTTEGLATLKANFSEVQKALNLYKQK